MANLKSSKDIIDFALGQVGELTEVKKNGIIVSVSVAAGGTGYTVGDLLTLATGTNGVVKVATVNAGVVTSVTVIGQGYNYSLATFATTGGSGTLCTIKVEVIKTIGESEYRAKALTYLNRIYKAVLSGSNEFDIDLGEPWTWAKDISGSSFTQKTSYSTGTMSLTQGSTNGSFSDAPADSLAGWILKIDGYADYYTIATHTAGATAFTIDLAWIGDSFNGSYTLYKLDYALDSNILRLVTPLRTSATQSVLSSNGQIEYMDWAEFQKEYPLFASQPQVSTRFTIKHYNSLTGIYTIRLNSSPLQENRIDYDFIEIPTDLTDSSTNYPIVPEQHRSALAYGVAHYLAMDKNDSRADKLFVLLQRGLKAMTKENARQKLHTSSDVGKIYPRLDLTKRQKGLFRLRGW